ncbi:MAG: hypothetical protein KGZ64_04865 [Thermaerobacter sp.]|nr:hypothetical protein [Thermaerobacter sp.]
MTGKVERFNRVVDSFLSEAALEKPKTLERLNELFWVWLSECYQNKSHSALDSNGISLNTEIPQEPEFTYKSDRKEIRFVDAELLANAFLHCEVRKVDKVGCISFMGRKYEGHAPFKIKELVIGEKAGKRPPLPPHMQKQPAEESPLLGEFQFFVGRAPEDTHSQYHCPITASPDKFYGSSRSTYTVVCWTLWASSNTLP